MECALPSSTPLQSQTHPKPDTNSEVSTGKCLMTYFVSTNENFGPPHKSLKSTESVWSVNRESYGFESIGIVIISRSLVLGQGRQYSTIHYNTIRAHSHASELKYPTQFRNTLDILDLRVEKNRTTKKFSAVGKADHDFRHPILHASAMDASERAVPAAAAGWGFLPPSPSYGATASNQAARMINPPSNSGVGYRGVEIISTEIESPELHRRFYRVIRLPNKAPSIPCT